MGEKHSFDEYTEVRNKACVLNLFSERLSSCNLTALSLKQVEEFRALSKKIRNLPGKAHFIMVHLDCEELKQGLSNKANSYAEILLRRMIIIHREQNLQ